MNNDPIKNGVKVGLASSGIIALSSVGIEAVNTLLDVYNPQDLNSTLQSLVIEGDYKDKAVFGVQTASLLGASAAFGSLVYNQENPIESSIEENEDNQIISGLAKEAVKMGLGIGLIGTGLEATMGSGVYDYVDTFSDYALYGVTLSPIAYGVNRGFKGLINLTLKD